MALHHVGLTVGDLDHAIHFYPEAGELALIRGPYLIEPDGTPASQRRMEIFGPDWKGARVAHLASPDGGGVELFEFLGSPTSPESSVWEYWRLGVSHIALTVRNIRASRLRIQEMGGTARTEIYTIGKSIEISYCADPWGNAVELSSHSYWDLVTNTKQS